MIEAARRVGAARGPARQQNVLLDRELRHQAAVLGHVADAERGAAIASAARSNPAPAKLMRPALAPTRPITARSVVVLPAPLRPTRPTISPGCERQG